MSLDCLRCFVWIALIHISNQYREEGSDVYYSKIANDSMLKNVSQSVKPYPNNCACHDRDGRIYNLAPLQNTDGTPSFRVNSTKYPGHSYSYNPCSPFKLGPIDGGCQRNVAICWWVPNGPPGAYYTIGNQDKARCEFIRETRIPILVYKSGEFKSRKATVKPRCDEKRKEKDEAIFEILDEDNWIFQLTHLCSCGDGCPISPETPTPTKSDVTTPPNPFDPMRVVIPVAVSAGTSLLFVPLLIWLLVRRRNNNNNGNERERERDCLLGDGAVEQVQNPIPGSSAERSRGPSRSKVDVNISSANV